MNRDTIKPIIHAYAICFNEEVLISHFLDYYSGFCEQIIIYDNFSYDKSIQISNNYENVIIYRFDTKDKIRDDIYLKIKNNSWKQSRGIANYVIVCDIDEFIYHPNIIEFFNDCYKRDISMIQCLGFHMITDCLPDHNNNLFKDFPYGIRAENFDKYLVFDPNKVEEVNYEYGAHACCPIGVLNYNKGNLKLLHYKYLTIDYLIERYAIFKSRLSNINRKLKLGYHYSFSKFRIKNEFNLIKRNSVNIFKS